jgi:hypothetical protein
MNKIKLPASGRAPLLMIMWASLTLMTSRRVDRESP